MTLGDRFGQLRHFLIFPKKKLLIESFPLSDIDLKSFNKNNNQAQMEMNKLTKRKLELFALEPPKYLLKWRSQSCTSTLTGFCLIALLLVLCSLSVSCQNVEFPGLECRVKSIDGPIDNVGGTWQLVRVKTSSMENGRAGEIDYSCKDILYNFSTDGTVEVLGGGVEYVPDTGTYDYELTLTPFGRPDGYTLKIGSRTWACFIEPGNMTLDASGLDGEIFELVRI